MHSTSRFPLGEHDVGDNHVVYLLVAKTTRFNAKRLRL